MIPLVYLVEFLLIVQQHYPYIGEFSLSIIRLFYNGTHCLNSGKCGNMELPHLHGFFSPTCLITKF